MSVTYTGVTLSLPSCNPNASRTDKRPVQLTWTDGHVTRTNGHVDNSGYGQLKKKDEVANYVNFDIP